MKKVDEFRESCLDDIKRQIEVQKIFINSSHPDFDHYKRMITGSKNKADNPEDDGAEDEGDRSGGDDSDDSDADLGMRRAGLARGDVISIRSFARGLFSEMQQKTGQQATRDEGVIR